MSYADAILDLSGVDVACLSGQNGAGKSALLDAITWALWECARSSSDELIRLTEKEMWVDIIFSHEGQRYRIRRSRQKGSSKSGIKGTSKGTLELQVATVDAPALVAARVASGSLDDANVSSHLEHNSWRTLTSGSMRDTQKTICELLRMDFDTFVNSAYLRQGKADEFTTRPASERKQILSEILGLSYFDKLQEKAREKARHLKARAEYLENSLGLQTETEAQFNQATADFTAAQSDFDLCHSRAQTCENEVNALNQVCQQFSLSEQRVQSNKEQIALLQSDIEKLSQQECDLKKRLSDIDDLLKQSPIIEESARSFTRIKQEAEELDRRALIMQELSTEKLDLQTQLAKIRSRLEYDFGTAQSALTESQSRHDKLKTDLQDCDKVEKSYEQYRELIKQESDMAKSQETFAKLTGRITELQSVITEYRIRLEAELGQKENKAADLDKLLKGKESLTHEKESLEAESVEMDKSEAEFDLVEEKGLQIKSDLEAAEKSIEALKIRQNENLAKIEELHDHADSSICPLCASTIVDRAAVVERYRKVNEAMDNEISALKDQIMRLESERASLRKKYLELKKHLDGRKRLDIQIGQFNEKLGAVDRAEHQALENQKEIASIQLKLETHEYAQLEKESLISLKAEIHKLDFDPLIYSNLQSQLRMQRQIEPRYHQLQRDKTEFTRLQNQLPNQHAKVNELSSQISSEAYGEEIRDALKSVQEKITALNYDRTTHDLLKQQLSDLLPSCELFRDLQRALNDRPALEQSEASCREMLENKEQQILCLNEELARLDLEIAQAPALRLELIDKQIQFNALRGEREELGKKVAVLESTLTRLQSELSGLQSQKRQLDDCRRDIDDFTCLAEAFGKKGIQAVIIENAIPEIETEANRILSRLTENKMHIGLITQHKTKSGGLVETLDLVIGDDLGTRNYELFSGGEAFKVNFAVRVALSKLLARRSGAKLETLIIDEGFGSQDDISRDRLVKAIKSIQTDFARILVITHMHDIKEMFPVQIAVSKVNGASQLQIVY